MAMSDFCVSFREREMSFVYVEGCRMGMGMGMIWDGKDDVVMVFESYMRSWGKWRRFEKN